MIRTGYFGEEAIVYEEDRMRKASYNKFFNRDDIGVIIDER